MSTWLETVPSVITKISGVNPCLSDCTGLFTFKGIHILGSAGASTMQHHLKTGAQLDSSDCRQWVPPTFTVCSWGEQPENFPAPKSSSAGCSAPPQDRSGKVQLPSLISNNQKWRGNGHCVSFPIRQSLKAHSVYIASFSRISLCRLACKAFQKQNKHFFHFALAALKVLLLYCQVPNLFMCACGL